MLEVENLSVRYGRVEAVRDVSFSVAEGSLVTLVGANGAGKSTIINAVSGIVRPHSGRVRFRGADITRAPAHKLVARGLVQVPEGRQILASLTVAENLAMGGWHRGRGAARTIDEMYQRFGVLAERRDLPAGTLSGGEQQMLAIARALVAEPVLLLLDEPSMGLAPLVVNEVFDVVEQIRATGTTVVLVEQNARRALRAASDGYVLRTGQVVRSGPAAELLADDDVVRAYLGTA
ncbi:ABC transporter ATP-binding protein [Promicromonospora iranensis]|uniref:ABC transporter ATP-binding protein n=1 Tax=Promicromonospora iranensis TaxID=1105144 RepID=UPI0030B899C9